MSVLLLFLCVARASSLVLGVGPATALGLEGRHARPFIADDDRVHLGYGRSGSFRGVPLGPDLVPVIAEDRVIVNGHGRFVDHMFVPCGGGTFLHVASGRVRRPDDSAWATPVGADLGAGTTRTIVRESTTLATNDPAAVCAGPVVAVGLAGAGEPGDVLPPDWLYVLDDEFFAGGEVASVADASVASRMTGNSMLWDDAAGALRVFGMEPDVGLVVATFDGGLEPMEIVEAWPDLPADQHPYWAQGVASAGGATLLAHMVRGDGDGFAQDTGQVALTVLGPDLMPLETWQLTEFSPPDGAMRPGVARVGTDLALVTFDVGGRVWAMEVELDGAALDALGGGGGDDTAGPVDTAPTVAGDGGSRAADGRAASTGGGCASTPLAPDSVGLVLLGMPLLALTRRRWIPRYGVRGTES